MRLDAGGDGIGESDRFEQVERRLVDAFHVALRQGLVVPALHARPDRRLLHRNRPAPAAPGALRGRRAGAKVPRQSIIAHLVLV